jgi:UDP-N-acetyl-D-mannosaminuronate dehydrogenase
LKRGDVVVYESTVYPGATEVKRLLKNGGAAVLDVRSILNKADKPDGMDLWRL